MNSSIVGVLSWKSDVLNIESAHARRRHHRLVLHPAHLHLPPQHAIRPRDLIPQIASARQTVKAVLTGHVAKDATANMPITIFTNPTTVAREIRTTTGPIVVSAR